MILFSHKSYFPAGTLVSHLMCSLHIICVIVIFVSCMDCDSCKCILIFGCVRRIFWFLTIDTLTRMLMVFSLLVLAAREVFRVSLLLLSIYRLLSVWYISLLFSLRILFLFRSMDFLAFLAMSNRNRDVWQGFPLPIYVRNLAYVTCLLHVFV